MDCKVCGKGDDKRPTIFKGEEYCCEAHRQLIEKAEKDEAAK